MLSNNSPLDKKVWAFFGDMFIKLPTSNTKDLIEKGLDRYILNARTNKQLLLDQKLLDEKVDKARSIMKQNAIAIQEMEGKNDIHGFSLKGITATDLYNKTM